MPYCFKNSGIIQQPARYNLMSKWDVESAIKPADIRQGQKKGLRRAYVAE